MHPIQGDYYQTQGYGSTEFARSPAGQRYYKAWGGLHLGLDFGTHRINLPAISTVMGKVVFAGANGGYGNLVEVQGSDGWRRMYAHLSSISVKQGDPVIPGQILGRVGTTGSSSAIHLHFGHRKAKLLGGWEYRDPSFEVGKVFEPAKPTKRLIKAHGDPKVYVWNGQKKFHIPDMPTFTLLFTTPNEPIEELEADVVAKLPEGPPLTSLA